MYCWIYQTKIYVIHPGMYHEFVKENFTIKSSLGNLSMLLPDQVIEQAINRDQNWHGGIIG